MAPCSETCSETTTSEVIHVDIGQITVADSSALLRSVLGSCVGVVLYHRRKRVGALAHVVLPDSAGRGGHPGKFADTAIPEVLRLMEEQGANPEGVVARVVGGASMFGGEGPVQIGRSNIEAVEEALQQANISIKARHVGKAKGRRVTLDCDTGELIVEVVGALPVKI